MQQEEEEEAEEEIKEAAAAVEINQVFERRFLFPPQRLKALKMNEWLRICKNSPTDRFRSFRIVRNVKPVFADQ